MTKANKPLSSLSPGKHELIRHISADCSFVSERANIDHVTTAMTIT